MPALAWMLATDLTASVRSVSAMKSVIWTQGLGLARPNSPTSPVVLETPNYIFLWTMATTRLYPAVATRQKQLFAGMTPVQERPKDFRRWKDRCSFSSPSRHPLLFL